MTGSLVHPELLAHPDFSHLRLGRVKPAAPFGLRLADYLTPDLEPPASCDWTCGVEEWPMYGNDRLGDCTCAAAGHLVQAWSQAAGDPKTPTVAAVESMYWETGDPPAPSGSPGSVTDTGRDEQNVLQYWHQHGCGADRILAYAAIDPADTQTLKAALYLFGGLYSAILLPLTAQGQQVWDVVPAPPSENQPGSWGGHAVPYLAYDPAGYTVATWGGLLRMTNGFHAAYCDQLFAIISPDFLEQGDSPQGLDVARLEADLAALRA